jgi:hypothetical protein
MNSPGIQTLANILFSERVGFDSASWPAVLAHLLQAQRLSQDNGVLFVTGLQYPFYSNEQTYNDEGRYWRLTKPAERLQAFSLGLGLENRWCDAIRDKVPPLDRTRFDTPRFGSQAGQVRRPRPQVRERNAVWRWTEWAAAKLARVESSNAVAACPG